MQSPCDQQHAGSTRDRLPSANANGVNTRRGIHEFRVDALHAERDTRERWAIQLYAHTMRACISLRRSKGSGCVLSNSGCKSDINFRISTIHNANARTYKKSEIDRWKLCWPLRSSNTASSTGITAPAIEMPRMPTATPHIMSRYDECGLSRIPRGRPRGL